MSLFSLEDVQVENKIPSALAPGQKKLIELTIRKGDIQGFSKLEIPLPVGFNAIPNDIKGASFTFKAQSAKFVWMQLPEEASFTITYYIETSSTVKGVYDIGGMFSYVKDNRRLDMKLPSKPVIIKEQAMIDAENLANNPDAVVASTTSEIQPKTVDIPETLADVAIPANIKREAEVVEMICERSITKVNDTEFVVTLNIKNNSISGFGKILETLPDHCKTEKINDAGAVVTQDKNTIKFVWFEIPTSDHIELSYKVSCLKPIGEPVINGQLSYTDNGNPIIVPVVQPNTSATEVLADNPKSNSENNNTASSETPKTTNTNTSGQDKTNNNSTNTESNYAQNNTKNSTNSNSNNNATAENKTSKIPVTSVPSAETGVTYKVQILAAHRVVNKTYFEQKFNFSDRFNIENHEGWIKYTTGSFSQYKDARDERVKITSNHGKLPGPFVTAYNDGQRITVQEALLITNQQWYK